MKKRITERRLSPPWGELRSHGADHLWHQTSRRSFESILRDQQIVPNVGQLPWNYPQSQSGYARHLGAVSLFDLSTPGEEAVWDAFELMWTKPVEVLIGMRRDALKPQNLHLPYRIAADGFAPGYVVIPWVEALHVGPIPASAFRSFVLAAPGDRWITVEPSDDVSAVLSAVNEEWSVDQQRRAERRATSRQAARRGGEVPSDDEMYARFLERMNGQALLKAHRDEQDFAAFDRIPGAWLMQFEDGWYAYRDDEARLGPFMSKVEAARAGQERWLE